MCRATLTIVLVLGLQGRMLSATWGAGKVSETVTDADIRVVVTAIEDEIYAEGYHTAYIDVGADARRRSIAALDTRLIVALDLHCHHRDRRQPRESL